MVAASCAGSGPPAAVESPSPVDGALSQGLIAYVGARGVGVLDPATGKAIVVAPLPAGSAFKVSGPVWAPAPGLPYPVLYFTIHDDRPAESRTTSGVVPYDWLFRVDPFAGVITPVAASYDFQSEGRQRARRRARLRDRPVVLAQPGCERPSRLPFEARR